MSGTCGSITGGGQRGLKSHAAKDDVAGRGPHCLRCRLLSVTPDWLCLIPLAGCAAATGGRHARAGTGIGGGLPVEEGGSRSLHFSDRHNVVYAAAASSVPIPGSWERVS